MRGLRSLIVLLVIALPLGWYAYRDSTKPADSGRAEDRTRSSPSKRTRSRRSRSSPSPANGPGCRSPAPSGRSWRRPARRRIQRDLQRHERTSPRSRCSASSTRTRRTSRIRPGAAAHRGGVQGRRQGADAAHRAEDATGDRPLRQARRRDEGVPDPVVSRVDLQPDDVRSARQGGAQDRSRQARCAGVHGRRQDLAVREARRRMADRGPCPGAGRFLRHRGPREPPDRAADEVDRRRARSGR